ncbi:MULTISPECIES: nucleotidyl transferase AbiEii/AbiGii toxin family protein [Ralstonia solanacearum species complex]|uniref:nucleotidyl transferase AbiEii/AbiGii toxin family protein n=1 Tax=Ralstonia solanacearum species complex TaxID=3116862 RepID=UPI00078C0671|nr:nucleotidyl transferase AbiEii/AbiGii toxin family protein [Ralstonia solanacearum]AMP39484.1 hypothetical protein LBM2029_17890 [Ralstonia solanacearum]AXV78870.1 hypothetical protein CJO76_17875 [Ralstonia solanacearum]AXV88320.1 hypothetical protein CJO78_18405 [Ralstonia solanacearum]AXV92892.1 hypothetical protein CJO79_17860 [Ralstonia solanacearum]AXW07799.1 hypothetical protein CJO82_18060 [Ralstonia solanacearum]
MMPADLPLVPPDPQSATDYDDRTTVAVKSVLIEIGQLLGSFKGKFAVVGGAVPWLLLDNADMRHVGTLDVDLSLDAHALAEDDEYVDLVRVLQANGYHQPAGCRRFQLVRTVPATDGGAAIDVVVDFLMPRAVNLEKHKPPFLDDFAVQKADGAELGFEFATRVKLDGAMPDGGTNRVEVHVASIPALLAMKGYALNNRLKRKDAYDIYYCIRNYRGQGEALAEECRPLLASESALQGYRLIASKFNGVDDFGPTSVRQFLEDSDALGEMTPEQCQRDAFEQVDAWLKAIGLRQLDPPPE